MKGTRKGGLSSPFLFNLFYQDMITELPQTVGGIRINHSSYNVFCYADDILITSTTVTGLQTLIDVANRYIGNHGLSFNPIKTQCIVFGRCMFEQRPIWNLNSCQLQDYSNSGITYLGAFLSKNTRDHVDTRIKACRRAFYALQGAGLHSGGLTPNTMAHVWRTAIQPILTYSIQCLPLTKTSVQAMDKAQSRLLKAALGLTKFCKSTPLLHALKISKISLLSDVYTLDLIKSHFSNGAKGRCFYSYMLLQYDRGHLSSHNNLVVRSKTICSTNDISLFKYILDDSYAKECKTRMKAFVTDNGLVDSVRYLFSEFTPHNRHMVQSLLMPF